ncbi:MAG: STAS/SEC14 domain-containing protein [Desulfuromonas sp.]|nr:STAS/SEC14 domain-containing protein [Desulfuromonas sp.]
MIERIQDLPANVLGFSAIGKVTGSDYENVLIPAVEALLTRQKKVRLLYCLGEQFSGFDMQAMWDDTKLGLQHLTAWEKIAVVSDLEWIKTAVKVFGFVMPGKVRVFANGELAEARQWLSED